MSRIISLIVENKKIIGWIIGLLFIIVFLFIINKWYSDYNTLKNDNALLKTSNESYVTQLETLKTENIINNKKIETLNKNNNSVIVKASEKQVKVNKLSDQMSLKDFQDLNDILIGDIENATR